MWNRCSVSAQPPLFYFGAMSPYSWLAAERIDALLPTASWRGILAGVIFEARGRTSWGLTEQRAEGLAECERRAAAHGLGPIIWPQPWPTSDLHATRGMLFAEQQARLKPFALEVMRMAFREGIDIAQPEAVLEAGRRVGLDPGAMAEGVGEPALKQRLRKLNDEALAAGVFGVPTVLVAGKLFWGDDRLENAADAYRAKL
jgi:2-hydroxychromene-2-carboxylate isomerase